MSQVLDKLKETDPAAYANVMAQLTMGEDSCAWDCLRV